MSEASSETVLESSSGMADKSRPLGQMQMRTAKSRRGWNHHLESKSEGIGIGWPKTPSSSNESLSHGNL